MNEACRKVLIIGVGNSGTKLLGELVHGMLEACGYQDYWYEPLYWSGRSGERGITLDRNAIEEHKRFPLLPGPEVASWPWMDDFISRLQGLTKFIRAGSRARLVVTSGIKIIWITRELYSYLASMQKNFPRCEPNAGWHHRPGEYDDFERIRQIYAQHDLSPERQRRVEVEAAWWHLHNDEMLRVSEASNVVHVKYEDLCDDAGATMAGLADFLEVSRSTVPYLGDIHSPPAREVSLSSKNTSLIEEIAGGLDSRLYGNRRPDGSAAAEVVPPC